ncbi:MAG: hypothetical protein F6K11_22125, partial [Leptolyngbya sp. SIO3F4]|nr:hypothetical protein [Leptolyngbya sp. SIO3F4]
GVHANKDHVFVAKGHEGLYILNESDNSINALFDFPGSANYVRSSSNGKNVFVANGIGGLKILAKNDPLNYGDPYCTNETVYEPYNGGNGIVRLTAMGNYKENGQYGKRWRIRNELSQDITVYWDMYNGQLNGSFFVPAKTSVHFTSHKTNGTGNGGTMRLFANPNFTNQLQVKAHGGNTKDLALCGNGGNQYIACAQRPKMTPKTINTTYTVGNGVTQWFSSPNNSGNTLQNDLVIYGDFHYCGSMRVITNTVIQNGGLFDMEGSLTIDRDLNIASGSKLIVEGALTVVGNLNFSGTIEFVGAGASVTVFGNVNRNAGAQVIGSYTGTPL